MGLRQDQVAGKCQRFGAALRRLAGTSPPLRIASLATAGLIVALVCATATELSPTAARAERDPDWKVFDWAEDATPQAVVTAMLALAKVEPKDVVYDLGCGDGRIVVTAAKSFGAKAVGVDTNSKMIVQARANAEKSNVADKTTFIEGDIFKTDLSSATVITLFLWPSVNVRLRPRLLELAPGTRIVSHQHRMVSEHDKKDEEWHPDRSQWVKTGLKSWGNTEIHLWIVPAKIAGAWQLEADGRAADVKIEQKYQRFFGSALVDGRAQPVRNGRISGTTVSFDLAVANGKSRRYTGRVTPTGEIEGEGWRAKRKQ